MKEKLADLTLQDPKSETTPKKKRRSWPVRLVRGLFLGFAGLLVLVVVLCLGLGLWLRTDQARTLVQEQVNAQLEPILAKQGLHATLTSLTGTLPMDWVAGLKVSDEKGLWLTVPELRFSLDIGLFPPKLTVAELRFLRPTLHRLPVLPPSTEPPAPPSPPLTPKGLQTQLAELSKTLFHLPDAIPEVAITRTGIEDCSLPKELLGFPATVTALLDVSFAFSETVPGPRVVFSVPRLEVRAQELDASGHLTWKSGTTEETWLAGALDMALSSTVDVVAFVKDQGLRAEKLAIACSATGSLLSPTLSLTTSCPELESQGQKLSKVAVALAARPLDLAGCLSEKLKPLVLDLTVNGHVNGQAIALALQSFAQLQSQESFTKLRAGVRKLHVNALGLVAEGGVHTVLGAPGIPPVEGTLSASINDFRALSALVPDQTLAGNIATVVRLAHDGKRQKVDLNLDIPTFSVTAKGADPISVSALRLAVASNDILGVGDFSTTMSAAKIAAGPLSLGLNAGVSGKMTGPIAAKISTTGGITTDVRATWQKGLVSLDALQVQTHPGLFSKEFAKAKSPLAIRLSKSAKLSYGDDGFSVKGLDIRMLPAGRLTVDGGIRQKTCSLTAALEAFDLTAWRALIADLPKGVVRMACSLHGNLSAPRGTLRLMVDKLQVPKIKLEPLDLALNGTLESGGSGSRATVSLEVPKKTVTALGGQAMEVKAAVPLVFADNGVPKVPEKGALSGTVVWKGRLAPLWKFSPLSDRKVGGYLDCALHLGGTVAAPTVKGKLALDQARFEDPIVGILLRDIFCTIGIDGRLANGAPGGKITVLAGLSDGMGGTLKVDGETPLDASKLAISAHIDHLRPLRRQDVRISLSGDVAVTGSATAPDVKGAIVVNNGAIQLENIEAGPAGVTTLPIQEAPKKTVASAQGAAAKKSTQPQGAGSLNITIKSPGRFLVDGFGLSTEWKTDIAITGTPTQPIIDGEIAAVKGSMDFLNKIFSLEKGIVILNADNIANPLVDILLANSSTDITSYIRVSGSVKKLKLSLTSDPAMPQDDVMAHILFGRNANELGQSEALQLAAAMARMASGLGSGMNDSRKALGLDVMRLKSGGKDGSSSNDKWVEGMALESGKYINDYIYVGVEQGVKQGSTAGIIQLEITPKLKLEMRSQQSSTKGSLNWKHNY